MRLLDLHPQWVGAGGPGISDAHGNPVPERHGVGIMFDCPCGGDCEPVYLGFQNPVDGGLPHAGAGHPLWERRGDDFATLTIRPSIQRIPGVGSLCRWHGFVTVGEVVPC